MRNEYLIRNVERYVIEKCGEYFITDDGCYDFSPDIDDADVFGTCPHAEMAVDTFGICSDDINIIKIRKKIYHVEYNSMQCDGCHNGCPDWDECMRCHDDIDTEDTENDDKRAD